MNENVALALQFYIQFVHRQSNIECLCAIVLIDRNCVLSTVEFVHFVGKPRRMNNAELIIVCNAECRLRQQQSTTIVPALHFDTLNETNDKKKNNNNKILEMGQGWIALKTWAWYWHSLRFLCTQKEFISSHRNNIKKWIYGALTVQLQCLNYVLPTLAVAVDWEHVHTAAAPAFFFSLYL